MAQPNPGSSNGTVEHLMAAQIIRRLEQRIHFVMDIASSDTKNMVKDIMYDVYFEKEDYRLRVLELEDINNNLKLLLEEHGIDYSRVDYFPPVRPPFMEMADIRAGPGALSITLQVGPSPEPVVEHSVGPSEEHDESLVSQAEPVAGASAIPAEEPPVRTAGHVVEPLTEPSAETVSQPPVTEPLIEPSSEPVAEQQLGSVEPVVEPSVGPTDPGATEGGASSLD